MPASPTSPGGRPHKSATHSIPGFISPPKPRQRPIYDLSVAELYEKHARNKRILSNPYVLRDRLSEVAFTFRRRVCRAPSTSAYVQRLSAEQVAIEARLTDLVGIEKIQEMLKRTTISEDDNMKVDGETPPEVPQAPQAIETKRRILSRYGASITPKDNSASTFTFEEAARIERETHAQDERRRQEAEERRRRKGLPIKGEVLSEKDRQARVWAFMTYKPSESDLEDDDDESSDEDDPAKWFDDDQDDGRKGQDIVEPDEEDYSKIIRIDESRMPRGVFYEPRDDE
ncbi:hypothetical protein EUX98_g539 [Antrodiella citrinella]|uniref:Uncharacterized protein n=1 Tax=Antrodiella citrinella TaxID=2447956 RepID=A0A4S4N5W2_9APHY|nr:hypothetical protein EUX98_g539 [Antrodiella citrinella]